MAESPPTANPKPFALVAGIVASIVGAVVGRYSGMHLLIPLGLAVVAGAIGSKLGPKKSKPMVAAFAVQAGHGLSMALGLALLGTFDLNVLDVVVVFIGVTLLLFRPGLFPVLLLSTYQLAALALNLFTLASAEFGSDLHKALLVHVIFRALGLVLMIIGLYKIRKPASNDDEVVRTKP